MSDIDLAKKLIKDVFDKNVLELYDQEKLKTELDNSFSSKIENYSIDKMTLDEGNQCKLTVEFTIQNVKLTTTVQNKVIDF